MYAFASSSTPAATNSDDVIRIADGLDQIARDAAFAADGQPGRATLFVSATPHADFSPNAYVTSLADNNFIYVNGTFRGAFNRGQTLEFDAAQGDIVTSERGVTGVYSISGGVSRPVEMASAAFAGRQFFWYAFRSPPHRHFIQSLAMPATVRVYGPNPTVNADGTSPDEPIQEVTLNPYEVFEFTTSQDAEYYATATQPVVLTTTNYDLDRDQRVVLPLAADLFGHTVASQGGGIFISALFADTNFTVFMADGVTYTGTASPGSPHRLNPLGFESHYANSGWFIVRADGPIAGFAGADGAGGNATTFAPLSVASQVAATPLAINDNGGREAGLAFVSEFEGRVAIYQNDGTHLATRELLRHGSLPNPATDTAHQRHPAAALYHTGEGDFTAKLERGAYVVADVPILMIANMHEGSNRRAEKDETPCYGITPTTIKAEIRKDAAGLLRHRAIDGSGTETWEVC